MVTVGSLDLGQAGVALLLVMAPLLQRDDELNDVDESVNLVPLEDILDALLVVEGLQAVHGGRVGHLGDVQLLAVVVSHPLVALRVLQDLEVEGQQEQDEDAHEQEVGPSLSLQILFLVPHHYKVNLIVLSDFLVTHILNLVISQESLDTGMPRIYVQLVAV